MIRTGLFVLLVLFQSAVLFSGSPESLMDKANKAYMNESYLEAAELYEQIVDMHLESEVLYYNLGNAYYKSGQYALAILNYERALRLNPSGEAIQHNLRLARLRVGERSEPMPRLFFVEWHDSFIKLQSADGWAITAVVLVIFLSFGVALFFIFKGRVQKQIFFALSLMLLFGLLTSLYAANRQYEKHYMIMEAIVMGPRVTAKSAPSESSVDVFVIHEGRKLKITGEINDWYEVRLPDGNIGWIKKTAAIVI